MDVGENIDEPGVGWPRCGEIDIMELVGNESEVVHGTVHWADLTEIEGNLVAPTDCVRDFSGTSFTCFPSTGMPTGLSGTSMTSSTM